MLCKLADKLPLNYNSSWLHKNRIFFSRRRLVFFFLFLSIFNEGWMFIGTYCWYKIGQKKNWLTILLVGVGPFHIGIKSYNRSREKRKLLHSLRKKKKKEFEPRKIHSSSRKDTLCWKNAFVQDKRKMRKKKNENVILARVNDFNSLLPFRIG